MARVLIVDDAPFMRMKLKDIVKGMGYEIAGEAETGEEGVRLFGKTRPDLVIMDITMPGMNGVEAIHSIKALDPKAKILVCSAMGQQQVIVQALEAGAGEFIVKPFFEGRVASAINGMLS